MGCAVGESGGGEGPTLRSDVSWGGIRKRLGGGQELLLLLGVKRKMRSRIYHTQYCYVVFVVWLDVSGETHK